MTWPSISKTLATWIRAPRFQAAVLTVGALATAVIAVPLFQSTPVGQITAAVSDAPAQLVRTVEQAVERHYLGFDTDIYPGDRAMSVWARDGTYQWVGYYLQAPCHRDRSWSGKYGILSQMGWGVAVVYVGQQSWIAKRPAKKATTCSNAFVTASNGTRDATDAIAKAAAEGFAPGTVVFLDIERVNTISPAMRSYYTAWTATMLADGRYRPGFYAHVDNAARIFSDVKTVFSQAGEQSDPPFWIAGRSSAFSLDKIPSDVGHAFAAVWQGLLDVTRTHSGIRLPIDVNIAAVHSPSASKASPQVAP